MTKIATLTPQQLPSPLAETATDLLARANQAFAEGNFRGTREFASMLVTVLDAANVVATFGPIDELEG